MTDSRPQVRPNRAQQHRAYSREQSSAVRAPSVSPEEPPRYDRQSYHDEKIAAKPEWHKRTGKPRDVLEGFVQVTEVPRPFAGRPSPRQAPPPGSASTSGPRHGPPSPAGAKSGPADSPRPSGLPLVAAVCLSPSGLELSFSLAFSSCTAGPVAGQARSGLSSSASLHAPGVMPCRLSSRICSSRHFWPSPFSGECP